MAENEKYVNGYGRLIRYGHSNAEHFLNILSKPEHEATRMNTEEGDRTTRLVAADALQDEGRDEEAELLRGEDHVMVHGGSVVPAKIAYRQAFYSDNEPELDDVVENDGYGAALKRVAGSWDYGEGQLVDEHDGGGTVDRRHKEGNYIYGHNPHLGYHWLAERMEVPKTATHVISRGKFLYQR